MNLLVPSGYLDVRHQDLYSIKYVYMCVFANVHTHSFSTYSSK